MKRINLLLLASTALAMFSCTREILPEKEAPVGEQVTMKAYIPDTKVSLEAVSPEEGDPFLELKWEREDVVTVIGETTQDFTIANDEDYGAKYSTFTGTNPGGTSFSLIYPGGENGYRTVADVEAAAFGATTQSGNGTTDHLKYRVWMTGVDKYDEVSFTEEWATEHGGTLHQTGAIKLTFKVPDGTNVLKSVTLSGFPTVNFDNLEVPADRIITVYVPFEASEKSVAAGEELTLSCNVNNNKTYSKKFKPGAKSFLPGKMNYLQLNDKAWDVPQGEKYNPYEISSIDDLKGIKDKLVQKDTVFFKLTNDIDLRGKTFNGIGEEGGEFINFDGDGHKIIGYHATNARGFFDSLQGSLSNVEFTEVSLTGTKAFLGIWVGYSNNVPTKVYNVKVQGTATGISGNGGGVFGNCGGNVTLEKVDVDITLSTSGAYYGGLVGIINDAAKNIVIKDCTAKVDITSTSADGRVGGLVGACAYRNSSTAETDATSLRIENCKVLSGSKISVSGNFVGGIIGYGTDKLEIGDCSVDVTISGSGAYHGGILGTLAYISPNTNPSTSIFGKFTVKGSISGASVAGFAGYVGNYGANLAFKDCEMEVSLNGSSAAGAFAPFAVTGWSFDNCHVKLTGGAAKTGGFVPSIGGEAKFNNCSMQGDVTGAGNVGGFVGKAAGARFTNCSYSGNVTSTGAYVGGLIGDNTNTTPVAAYIEQCKVEGSVSGTKSVGGLCGRIKNGNSYVRKSYANVIVTNSGDNNGEDHGAGIIAGSFYGKIQNCIGKGSVNCSSSDETAIGEGGIVGWLRNSAYSEVSSCISLATVSGHAGAGGIVGGAGQFSQATAENAIKISKCIAWNPSVAIDAASPTRGAGAVAGYVYRSIKLEDCYRRADMAFTNSVGQVLYDQENSASAEQYDTNAGVNFVEGSDPAYAPYHGKAAATGATASSVAKTLVWDDTIWDLEGDVPALKWMQE